MTGGMFYPWVVKINTNQWGSWEVCEFVCKASNYNGNGQWSMINDQ